MLTYKKPLTQDQLYKMSASNTFSSITASAVDAPETEDSTVECSVTKVVNGWVLEVDGDTYIASDTEELAKMFITALVSKKLKA